MLMRVFSCAVFTAPCDMLELTPWANCSNMGTVMPTATMAPIATARGAIRFSHSIKGAAAIGGYM